MEPQHIYNTVAKTVVGSLTEEVLVIGIFFVAFAFIQHAVRNPDWLSKSDFWKRFVLLVAVMLFATYITAAYDIEYRCTIDAPAVAERVPSDNDRVHGTVQLTMLLPVDLIGVGLTCALFACLYANVGGTGPDEQPDYRFRHEMVFLFA